MGGSATKKRKKTNGETTRTKSKRELKQREKPPREEHVEEGKHEPTGRGCPTRRAGRRQLEDVSFPHVNGAKHKDSRAKPPQEKRDNKYRTRAYTGKPNGDSVVVLDTCRVPRVPGSSRLLIEVSNREHYRRVVQRRVHGKSYRRVKARGARRGSHDPPSSASRQDPLKASARSADLPRKEPY